MKKKAAFFSGTVLRRDIVRFLPVWGSYTLLLITGVLLLKNVAPAGSDNAAFYSVLELLRQLRFIMPLQPIYGLVCAVVLFSDLFRSGMCHSLHTMPLRREGWFLTHITAGLLFFLIPTGICSSLLMGILGKWWNGGLLLFGIFAVQYLFFFGAGVFSVMCAGNLLGTVAVYVLLNTFAMPLWWMMQVLYGPHLYGVELRAEDFLRFSPGIQVLRLGYMFRDYYGDNEDANAFMVKLAVEDWSYLKWLAGSGLVLLAGGLLLFRGRKLEAAGGFLAQQWLKPVFWVLFSTGAAAFAHFAAEKLADNAAYKLLAIPVLILCFFGGKMLTDRTVKIFKLRAVLSLGAVIAAMALSVVVIQTDILGIVRWLPDVETIAQISITTKNSPSLPAVVDTQEDMEKILYLHADRLENRDWTEDGTDCLAVELNYRMKSGRTVRRVYAIREEEQAEVLRPYLSRWQSVFRVEDPETEWKTVKDKIVSCYLGNLPMTNLRDVDEKKLLEAIYTDCNAGVMAQDPWFFRDTAAYEIKLTGVGTVYADSACINTVKAITEIVAWEQWEASWRKYP